MSFASPYHNNDDVLMQLFNELFREHEHKLYAFLVKVLRSDAQAKDIVQEVFLKLWTIRDQLHEIENMDAFLYRLAESKVYEALRATASREKTRLECWQRIQQTVDAAGESEARQFHHLIQTAIDQLPPQRRSVYLHTSQGVAQHQQPMTANTVRHSLAQAFRSIRKFFNA